MGREFRPEVRDRCGVPTRGLVRVWRPSQRSGRRRKAVLEIRASLPEVRDRSGGPPEGSVWVCRPSRRSQKHWEAISKVWEPPWRFGRPSRRFETAREALQEVWDW